MHVPTYIFSQIPVLQTSYELEQYNQTGTVFKKKQFTYSNRLVFDEELGFSVMGGH